MEDIEIWKDVVGYEEFYQISNKGRVKSKDRTVEDKTGRIRNRKSRLLSLNHVHYLRACLTDEKGIKKSIAVHKLVAIAFNNFDPNSNLIIDHINNNPLDNRPENLQAISQRENCSKDKTNELGVTGIRIISNKYQTAIGIKYDTVYLGIYNTLEEAKAIREFAALHVDKYNGNPKDFRKFVKSNVTH